VSIVDPCFCYFLFLPFKLACWLGVKWAGSTFVDGFGVFSVKIMVYS
jgi:hypothetical protein